MVKHNLNLIKMNRFTGQWLKKKCNERVPDLINI